MIEATWQHSSFRNSRPASMSTLHFVCGKPNGAATILQGANIHRTHQQSSILVLSHGMNRRFVLKGPFSFPCYHSHNDAILALEERNHPNTHTPMLSATPCVEMIRALWQAPSATFHVKDEAMKEDSCVLRRTRGVLDPRRWPPPLFLAFDWSDRTFHQSTCRNNSGGASNSIQRRPTVVKFTTRRCRCR